MDANKTTGEEARWQLHKNVACNPEQVLAATPHKTPTVRPPAPYPITKTIQVRRTRHAGHCWRSRDELIRDVLLWIPTHGRVKAGRPARTYIQQLCEDTGCCPEDLPRAMNDREEWREWVRDIRATSAIWWWWWWWYRGYTNANIGLYCVATRLNIFSTTKLFNIRANIDILKSFYCYSLDDSFFGSKFIQLFVFFSFFTDSA